MSEWRSGRVARKTMWNKTHFSLAIDIDGPDFTAGQFVRIGVDVADERVGRPYSLVNPPHERQLEIFFNIVPDGPLSSRLAMLEAGDEIWLNGAAKGLLTLEQVPAETRVLWMLATGTGVGPFLSILQTDEPWRRFDQVVLGYGVRYADNQGYGPLIRRLRVEHPGKFHFVPFVTGERVEGAFDCRIPSAIADGRLERHVDITLDPADSHVMLCGHSGMISDVVDVLRARGMRRHSRREPGHISTEKYH
ncbi:MAG: ferredoxin--NADP reductase [Gammaproteobacteria bacterium]|nr:ferredoxin--NADP reductase [Gammaproteobacteria bacterium]